MLIVVQKLHDTDGEQSDPVICYYLTMSSTNPVVLNQIFLHRIYWTNSRKRKIW